MEKENKAFIFISEVPQKSIKVIERGLSPLNGSKNRVNLLIGNPFNFFFFNSGNPIKHYLGIYKKYCFLT